MLLLLCTNIGFSAIGYWINDFFDQEKDWYSSKSNLFNNASTSHVILFIISTLCLAILPWVWLPRNQFVISLLVLEVLLFIIYAALPFRLKERGWLGVFVDSVYSSVLPAFILLATTRQDIGVTENFTLWEITLYLFLFVSGIRKILIHQLEDVDADNISATATLAVQYGVKRLNRVLTHIIIPTEIISMGLLLAALFQVSPWLSFILTALFLLRIFFSPIGENLINYHPERSHILNGILNGPQEVDLPLLALVLLCLKDEWYCLFLFFHVILFLPGHRQVLNAGKDYLAKPIYYYVIPELYYVTKRRLPEIYFGIVTNYYSVVRLADKLYARVKRAIVYVYHDILLWLYFKVIVWSYYNIVLKSLVSVWKAGFFVIHGKPHKPDREK